jgi:hypothetical protein
MQRIVNARARSLIGRLPRTPQALSANVHVVADGAILPQREPGDLAGRALHRPRSAAARRVRGGSTPRLQASHDVLCADARDVASGWAVGVTGGACVKQQAHGKDVSVACLRDPLGGLCGDRLGKVRHDAVAAGALGDEQAFVGALDQRSSVVPRLAVQGSDAETDCE